MRWNQLTTREWETLCGALSMMKVVHHKNGEVVDRIWTAYLEKYAPGVSRPTTDQLSDLIARITPFEGSLFSIEDRLLSAWALSLWASTIEMIKDDDLDDGGIACLDDQGARTSIKNFRTSDPLPVNAIKDLSFRLKSTVSSGEFEIVKSALSRRYSETKGENDSGFIANQIRSAMTSMQDIAEAGLPATELLPEEWMLIQHAMRDYVAVDEKTPGMTRRLFLWLQASNLSALRPRIQQTSWFTTAGDSHPFLLSTVGIERRNKEVDGKRQYRSFERMSRRELEIFWSTLVELSTDDVPPCLVDVECIENGVRARLLTKGSRGLQFTEAQIAEYGVGLPTIVSTTGIKIGLGGRSKLIAALEGIREASVNQITREEFTLTVLSNESAAGVCKEVVAVLSEHKLEYSGVEMVAITRCEDNCYEVSYGPLRSPELCSLILPAGKEDFRQLLFTSVLEWSLMGVLSATTQLVNCPSCDQRTKRMAIHFCEGSRENMCSFRQFEGQWRKGCGFNWLDSYDQDVSLKNIDHRNKLVTDRVMEVH